MPSQQHTCAYVKCKKKFYGTKTAKYCSPKCGTYQRRLEDKQVKEFNMKAPSVANLPEQTQSDIVDGIREAFSNGLKEFMEKKERNDE